MRASDLNALRSAFSAGPRFLMRETYPGDGYIPSTNLAAGPSSFAPVALAEG